MSSNIFGNSDEKAKAAFNDKVDTHSKVILNIVERQKDIEATLDLLNEKIELLDHNSIKNFKDIFRNTKQVKNDVVELKEDILKLSEFSSKITKQFKLVSSKDEVIKLERYIDLWNPMNFVTREELDNIGINSMDKSSLITKEELGKFESKIKMEIKDELSKIVEGFLKK